jgi:DNA-binding MarR family transcriptional regulator
MYEQLKLEKQKCFGIYTAARLIVQAYRPLLEPLGLTYTQYLVMLVLWEKDNQLVGDIGRRLQLDTNTLTPLLQRMEKEGFIIRTRGIADGRQTLVSLTKKGLHLEEQAKDIPSKMSATIDALLEQTRVLGLLLP